MELTTYSYGNALLTFDPKAEARLRWKIDLYIIPTVALLYLFCFIDRANIVRTYPYLPAFTTSESIS